MESVGYLIFDLTVTLLLLFIGYVTARGYQKRRDRSLALLSAVFLSSGLVAAVLVRFELSPVGGEARSYTDSLRYSLTIITLGTLAWTMRPRARWKRPLVPARYEESENRYRDLFESSGDAIFIHDMGDRFLEVNQVACERLGYSREKLLQMGPRDIDSPEYAATVSERIEDLRKGGHAFYEVAQVRRDGTVIPVILSSRIIEYKGKPAVLSIARDITERKQMEEDLRSAKERLEYVIGSKEVIFVSKPRPDYSHFDASYMSGNVVSLVGFESKEFIDNPNLWTSRVHPDDLPRYLTQVPNLWKRGHHTFEYRFLHKDGTYRWIHEEANIVRDAAGDVLVVIGYWVSFYFR